MGTTHRGPYDDSGIALAIVMSVIALMVLLATGAFFVASQTLVDTQMATRHDAAFQAASSGVVVAFTGLRSQVASGTTSPIGTWETTGTVGASYTAVTTFIGLNSNGNATYECTSTGTAPGGITEVVVATFAINQKSLPGMTYGSDVFYFGGYTAGNIRGSGDIYGPFVAVFPPHSSGLSITLGGDETVQSGPLYIVNGSLVLAKDAAQDVIVYTDGTITYKNFAPTAQRFQGLVPGTNHFYQALLTDTAPLSVTTVTATFLPQALTTATTQSKDNIRGDTLPGDTPFPNQEVANRGGAAYKVIGSSITIDSNTESTGSISATNPADVHDDFAYDANAGTLYVEGTVYVSGDLIISRTITYVGNGTIVCMGSATISGNNTSVMPLGAVVDKRHLLCVFTAGDLSIGVSQNDNNMKVVGAFYAVGFLQVPGNKPVLQGSFAAEKGIGSASNGVYIQPIPGIAGFVSPGLPHLVSTAGTTTTDLKMTSWRRL